MRALQIQNVVYNFTKKEKPSYQEAIRLEELRFKPHLPAALMDLAKSAEGTNQRLQLQVP